MKQIKLRKISLTKENVAIILISILSAILNFSNLSKEGYGNSYYAAAVKSMTLSLKNFFFVAFDPSGFVTIDKPPLGFWLQAISAKIFGYSGWSIILPQALTGVISVIVIYFIVKSSFGKAAALISALCLAVTPVFVAASRNNTVDNVLVLVLLLGCWALSAAASKGKFKYLILSMVLVGIGFNVKMLQAYMIVPALYITYLLSSATSIKKRIIHLAAGTVILLGVSLSWTLVADSIPASSRPYIDSSTNNTVMELIVGHNGLERIGLGSSTSGGGAPGGKVQNQSMQRGPGGNPPSGNNENMQPPSNNGNMQMPAGGAPENFGSSTSGGGPGNGGASALQGTFGSEVSAGITRLFSKSILSDQIVWFIPIAIIGFLAASFKEKLRFRLDNKRKQALVLWFIWFLPEFIYFSWTTGTFHSYYLTMLAPPIAALTGIGIVSMWGLYKEGGWKSWFLPVALLANGAVQLLMLYYFLDYSIIVKILLVLLILMCFIPSVLLIVLNFRINKIKKTQSEAEAEAAAAVATVENNSSDNLKQDRITKLKKALLGFALAGLLAAPLAGSSAAVVYKLSSSFPAAGLELLSGSSQQMGSITTDTGNSALINFLLKNKTSAQKYLLVVGSSNDGADIIIKTGESVMSLGGFLGNNNAITLDEFKKLVEKGEIRYVMTGSKGGGSSNSSIMSWVQENGTVVSSSEYSSSPTQDNNSTNGNQSNMRFDGGGSGQLYDLKAYTDSLTSK